MTTNRFVAVCGLLSFGLAVQPAAVLALEARKPDETLAEKRFFKPELHLSSSNVPAESVLDALPNKAAWSRFAESHGRPQIYLDPRSGTPGNIVASIPMIPGTGAGNHVRLQEVGSTLGRSVDRIDGRTVGDLVRSFVVASRDAFKVDTTQLGPVSAEPSADHLWHVNIPQWVNGIPVRHARIAATINHGNLVLLGTETWGNVDLDTRPRITADQALSLGFTHVGGRAATDDLWKKPTLEIVPVAPQEFQAGEAFAGPIGAGYRHRLVWAFGFQAKGEHALFEVLVDAHTGEVLSFEDTNLYETRAMTGGVYPLTNTEVCPANDRCGVMQLGEPMPFADTGLAPPNDFTNSAGLFNYPGSGTITTHLAGKYVRITDTCGPVSESGAGDVLFGGVNGQHDCTSSGASAGNTPATRAAFYEVNKLQELARGWLPANTWLQGQLQTNVNIDDTCNAFYSPGAGTINFFKSGGGCRNTGEIAAIFDHEWGHALDDNDTGGSLCNPSETYADIAATYRLQTSCIGYGFFETRDDGCGMTADGTGFNGNEAQQGAAHCNLDCSGVRGADWDQHADHTPDTPANFICVACIGGSGPCGREVHCENAPGNQAAWDFAARDLQAPPFNLSSNDAFIIANKVFYQGSGNIGNWETCTCPSTSNGCGATNAYMQWLAADDDDGNLSNGTPHMTALFAAFNRHGIACPTPAPVNSGCSGAPTTAPNLTVSIGSNQLALSWSAVTGAVTYRVLRSEGFAGCNFGKAVIAQVAGTSFTDPNVANGRTYSYVVQAVGTTGACFGPSSTCVTAAPQPCAGALSLTRSIYNCSTDVLNIRLVDADLIGAGGQSVTVSSNTEPGPETTTLTENPASSGIFTGTFQTTGSGAVGGDGKISVSNGDTITIGYNDVSYCGTPNVGVTQTASVDCAVPVITNVRAENVTGNSADVKWDTDEGATSQVSYGLVPPPGISTPVHPALVTSHATPLLGLAECSTYFYDVSSSDAALNTASSDNGGNHYTFETGKNVTPTYASADPPLVILDNTTVLATVSVADVNVIQDVNVKVKIRHTYDGDLKLSLIGPGGTTVVLSNRRGGTGEDFNDTVFDDEATTPISGGSAPYAGSFRPDEPLTAFDGTAPAGTWTLKVEDLAGADTGTLDKFELTLSYPPQACGPSLKYQSHSFTETCSGTGSGGGNGTVEPGETVTMPVTITSNGTSATTGISASLSTTTPGVTILQGASSYPDLAAGSSSVGATPFQYHVDPSVACGTVLAFRIDATANEGTWNSVFTSPTGTPGSATTTYGSTDVPKHISDNSTVTSVINVAANQTVLDVNVTIGNITHTYDGDLDVFLIGPNGTRVELTTDNGGTNENFVNTVLDDEATSSITTGTAPYTGSFKPEGSLATLDGISSQGTWTLEITDDAGSDTGDLTAWSITLQTTAAPSCDDCDFVAPPGEVALLDWTGTDRDTLGWTSVAGATTYRLYRGAGGDLPQLLDGSPDSCERMTTAGLSSGPILTESPPEGGFQWFLVRAENAAAMGPAGSSAYGPRSQDSSGSCP